jgi:hypothetical protein
MSDIFNPLVQNSLKLTERRAWIEIAKLENGETVEKYKFEKLEGLNIKFSVSSCGQTFPTAEIGVCNLSQENIDYLINFFAVPLNKTYLNKIIKLYIGYGDTAKCIFIGNVVNTTLTSPPDIWFNFKAIFRVDALYSGLSISLKYEVSVKECYEAVAKELKMSLEWGATSEKKLACFVRDGGANNILSELAKIDETVGMSIYANFSGEDNGTIRTFDNLQNDGKINNPDWVKTFKLSAKSGLLGVPKFNSFGGQISCVLNPNINFLDIIDLSNIYQKAGNGKYRVIKVTHTGELRGNEFKTVLDLIALYGRNAETSGTKTKED